MWHLVLFFRIWLFVKAKCFNKPWAQANMASILQIFREDEPQVFVIAFGHCTFSWAWWVWAECAVTTTNTCGLSFLTKVHRAVASTSSSEVRAVRKAFHLSLRYLAHCLSVLNPPRSIAAKLEGCTQVNSSFSPLYSFIFYSCAQGSYSCFGIFFLFTEFVLKSTLQEAL